MIKQRLLGRTCLKVSELCLGTMNFGWKTDEQGSFAMLDAYYAAGGNFIAAAGHLGGSLIPAASTAFSEQVVGRWWQTRGIPRNQLVLSTRISIGRPPLGNVSFADFVRARCLESLKRLRVSRIDLVIFEWSEGAIPTHEMLEAFNALIRGGHAHYIGAANFPTWRVSDMLGRAYAGNHCRMELLQSDYSLMTRALFEPEAMALCQEQRLGFIARSPLAGGFLAPRNGSPDPGLTPARREWLERRFGNAYGDAALAAVREVGARHRASPAQVALAWVLHNQSVTSAMIGVGAPAQLHELIAATRLVLTDRDLTQLADATAVEEVRIAPPAVRREAVETHRSPPSSWWRIKQPASTEGRLVAQSAG